MNRILPIAIGGLLLLILVLFNTTYTVRFHELAVRTRFGKPAGIERGAGLHLKMPFFIDQVTKLDTRLQLVESTLETILTVDQQQVVVQAFLLWRIDDGEQSSLDFFTAYGSIEQANRQLEQQLQGALRAVGGFRFADLIGEGSKLPEAEDAILKDLLGHNLRGIKLVSVGISQILLPPKTTNAVLARMAAVQDTLARLEESKGRSEAEALKSNARTLADTIRNFADQWAAQISARGDAEAARYYEQMAQYRELAIFLTWLDTLRSGLSGATTFVTDVSKEPFHLLDPSATTTELGIPKPRSPRPSAPQDAIPPAALSQDDRSGEEG
jgi:regulator of protease activity HflC (stomatin/prohibitin superfamily)